MYLSGVSLKALGFDPTSIISGVMSLAMKGGAAGAPSLESPGVSVNTSVQTTVSPQISPVFVQQQSPSNSPVNAATQQIAPAPQSANFGMPTAAGSPTPGTPMTGAIPGVDYASGYSPTGTPLLPSTGAAASLPAGALFAGAGIILAAVLLKRRKKGGITGKHHRRHRKQKVIA